MAYNHTAFVPISEPKIGRSLLPSPFMSVPPTSTVTTMVKVKAYNHYIRKSQDSWQSTPILTCPPNFHTMDEEGRQGFRFNAILIGLLGVIAGAIIVATYHLVYSVWNYCRRQMLDTANTSQTVEYIQQETPSDRNRSVSTPRLIPICNYDKGRNEEMCAICLGDFKEGEQIRVLQDCLHFFHAACIDKWLNLHSSCPLCRSDTSSLPEQMAVSLPGSSRTPPLELYRLPDLRV